MQFNQRDSIAGRGTRLSDSRYPGASSAGDVLQGRDVGSVGPHRSSWGGLTVDICPHPYALRKITPSMSRTSSGSANPNIKTVHPRKKTVVRRVLPAQLQRNPTPPLPPSSILVHEEAVSLLRRSKRFSNDRKSVPISTVDEGEVPGARGVHAETPTSGSHTARDPSLAGSAGQSKRGKRRANVALVVNFLPNSSTSLPGPYTRKRAREENDPSSLADLSPPPSKKHRGGASVDAAIQTKIILDMGMTPTAHPATRKAPTTPSLVDTGHSRKRTAAPRAPSSQRRRNTTLNSKKHLKGRTSVMIPQEEVMISEGEITVEADSVHEEWEDREATTLEDIGPGEELIWVQDEKTRREAGAKFISQASSPPQWKGDPASWPMHQLPPCGQKCLPPAIDDEGPADSHKRHRHAAPSTNSLSLGMPLHACQRDGRVFAPWLGEFYPATVEDSWKKGDVTVCSVRLDDNIWVEVHLDLLYHCELREGDKVIVPGPKGEKLGRSGYVTAVPSWEDRFKVNVCLATTPQEEVATFDWKSIAVVADFVWKEWKDRKVMSLEDIGLGEEQIRMKEWKERKERRERKEAEAKRHRRIPLIFI